MKKGKNHKTKTAAKKLTKMEKAAQNEEREFQIRHEARLDQLRELRTLTEAHIVLDTNYIDGLISEVEAATTRVSDITS